MVCVIRLILAPEGYTITLVRVIIIIKLYCHIQRALYDELECSLALTHIVPVYTIKLNMANKYKI